MRRLHPRATYIPRRLDHAMNVIPSAMSSTAPITISRIGTQPRSAGSSGLLVGVGVGVGVVVRVGVGVGVGVRVAVGVGVGVGVGDGDAGTVIVHGSNVML